LPVLSFSEKADGRKLKYNRSLFFKKAVSKSGAAFFIASHPAIKPSSHFAGIAFAIIGLFLKLQSA
jgi:hypothetical protein